ncbi:MAG TPA: PAS domain-containing protein [Anaerolineae bacterium]|nr:PAS domain-containing protein [Anaerolineae bacterium]
MAKNFSPPSVSARYAAIMAHQTDAIVFVDDRLRVLDANPAAKKIFGVETPSDESLLQWVSDAPLIDLTRQVFDSKLEIVQQLELNGRVMRVKVVPLEAHPFPAVMLLLRDVSELQRLGRARRDLVANISHDLRTPITGIQLVAETLQNGALKDKKMAPLLLDRILDELEVLEQINQELMDLSLIESGRMPLKLVRCNLTKQVKKTIKRLKNQAQRKNLSLEIDLPPKIRVLADKGMLGRVLTNLIHNAIKFTEKGGITVRTVPTADTGMVCLAVADTGVGMSAAQQQRVFERFYKIDTARTRDGFVAEHTGTGLGLAIARHIIEAHGGKIWVESEPGRGTTFFFTLPGDEILTEGMLDDEFDDD